MNTDLIPGANSVILSALACGAKFAVGSATELISDILDAVQSTQGMTATLTGSDEETIETAYDLSHAGERTLAIASHGGINTLAGRAFSGKGAAVRSGVVFLLIDMPDNKLNIVPDPRYCARSARIPLLFPCDARDIPEHVRAAFLLSEKHSLPVGVRLSREALTTRSACVPDFADGAPATAAAPPSDMDETARWENADRQIAAIENYANLALRLNTIDASSPEAGIITTGSTHKLAKSVLPGISVLNVGIQHPLPRKLLAYFASLVKRLYVLEDGEPFMEEQLRCLGIPTSGSDVFTRSGALNVRIVAEGLKNEGASSGDTAALYEAPAPLSIPDGTADKGIRDFEDMLKIVRGLPPRRVCIAGSENAAALHAGIECVELGLGAPVFVGNAEVIRRTASEQYPEFRIDDYEIVDTRGDQETSNTAVSIVRSGGADILLKGGVNTPTLMRAVLNGKTGLRAGSLLSDTFVFEYPDEDGVRLVMITDGGVNLHPDLQQKIEILKNSALVAHSLGNKLPRVAMLAASETVNFNAPSTADAAVIMEMNRKGLIPGCIIEGPIALDVALNRKAAAIKGTASPVAGQADILVAASIDAANALAKSTTYFAGYRLSHIIVGGTAPILIASRSDTADAKLLSIALGSLMAKHFEVLRTNIP